MNIYTKSICFIVFPLSFINVSVYMHKFSFSISLIIFPISLIFCSIWPNLLAISLSVGTFPFTIIYNTRFKCHRRFSLYGLIMLCMIKFKIFIYFLMIIKILIIIFGYTGSSLLILKIPWIIISVEINLNSIFL